jgi:hypothetical protein
MRGHSSVTSYAQPTKKNNTIHMSSSSTCTFRVAVQKELRRAIIVTAATTTDEAATATRELCPVGVAIGGTAAPMYVASSIVQ